jgi:hypothetical protein
VLCLALDDIWFRSNGPSSPLRNPSLSCMTYPVRLKDLLKRIYSDKFAQVESSQLEWCPGQVRLVSHGVVHFTHFARLSCTPTPTLLLDALRWGRACICPVGCEGVDLVIPIAVPKESESQQLDLCDGSTFDLRAWVIQVKNRENSLKLQPLFDSMAKICAQMDFDIAQSLFMAINIGQGVFSGSAGAGSLVPIVPSQHKSCNPKPDLSKSRCSLMAKSASSNRLGQSSKIQALSSFADNRSCETAASGVGHSTANVPETTQMQTRSGEKTSSFVLTLVDIHKGDSFEFIEQKELSILREICRKLSPMREYHEATKFITKASQLADSEELMKVIDPWWAGKVNEDIYKPLLVQQANIKQEGEVLNYSSSMRP